MIEAYIRSTEDVLRLAGQMFLRRIDYELRRFGEDLLDFINELDRQPRRDWRARFDDFLADQTARGRELLPESRAALLAYLELWEQNVFGGPSTLNPNLPVLVTPGVVELSDSDAAAARLLEEIQKEHARLEAEQRRIEFRQILSEMERPPTERERTTADRVGDYLLDSGEQVLLGDFSDKTTALGTGIQIGAAVAGADLPADLRDLSANVIYWENSWSHVGKTALNAIALLPLVGLIKYLDEAAAVAKNADETVDVAKAKYAVGPYKDMKGLSPGLDAHHVGQQAPMKRLVPGYNPATAPTILVPKKGHTIRGAIRSIARSHRQLKSARDVIARDIRELRRVYPDIPNSQLQYLIELNKLLYPTVRKTR
jgi:hypothetical protein